MLEHAFVLAGYLFQLLLVSAAARQDSIPFFLDPADEIYRGLVEEAEAHLVLQFNDLVAGVFLV